MSIEHELPEIPEEATVRIRAAFKSYRKAVKIAESRAKVSDRQCKYMAGQLNQAKESEAKTYARLIDALALLGQYRKMIADLSTAHQDTK